MAFITKRSLPADSFIHTKKGLIKISDINEGDLVLTSTGYRKVKSKFTQGKQHLSTIYTECGEFKCTPNHRMAVIDNITGYKWVETQDLKVGDMLLTTRKPINGRFTTYLPVNEFDLSKPDKPVIELTADIAWFIGLFNEAGNYNTDTISENTSICDLTSFNITIYGNETIDSIKNIVKIFDSNAKCTVKRLYDENIYTIICISDHLSHYFNKNFKNNEIPTFIKEGTIDVRNAYIAGIIDGNINNYDNGFVITRSNKKRVDELQALCYSCGLETINIVTNTNKNRNNMSNILKIATHFTALVLNNIRHLHMTINRDDIYPGNISYPADMVKYFIEDEYKEDNDIRDYDINNKCMNDLFNKLDIDNIKRVNINDFDKHVLTLIYCPAIITKVVFDNYMIEDTYNIEVEDKHEFYCNGYLTHVF
jgi:ribonucleotide reductase class II